MVKVTWECAFGLQSSLSNSEDSKGLCVSKWACHVELGLVGKKGWGQCWRRRWFFSECFGGGVGWEVVFFPGVYSAVVHQAVYSHLLSIYQTTALHLLKLTVVLPMVSGSIRKHSGLRNSEER